LNNQKSKKVESAYNSSAANCYVVIKDMSAGNESVGEMWKETKIFDENATLKEVMKWALSEDALPGGFPLNYSRKNVIITRPHIGINNE